MACIVMVIGMACVVMAYIALAYIVTAYTVMAYIVISHHDILVSYSEYVMCHVAIGTGIDAHTGAHSCTHAHGDG